MQVNPQGKKENWNLKATPSKIEQANKPKTAIISNHDRGSAI